MSRRRKKKYYYVVTNDAALSVSLKVYTEDDIPERDELIKDTPWDMVYPFGSKKEAEEFYEKTLQEYRYIRGW